MQKSPLVPLILWQFAEAESQSSKDAGCAPDIILRGMQPVWWNILSNGFPKFSEGHFRVGVGRIQAPEGMCQLCERNR